MVNVGFVFDFSSKPSYLKLSGDLKCKWVYQQPKTPPISPHLLSAGCPEGIRAHSVLTLHSDGTEV